MLDEWTYVITIEALIFLLLCAIVTAQQLNVFVWIAANTWPVLGTCVLFTLVYCFLLLLLAIFVKSTNYGHLNDLMQQACLKSSMRLILIIFLWLLTVCVNMWTSDKQDWALTLCLLWGNNCNEVGYVLWELSYSVYLAVLFPLFAFTAGLILSAAGNMRSVVDRFGTMPSAAPQRTVGLQCAFSLALCTLHTVEQNIVLCCGSACTLKNNSAVCSQKPQVKQIRALSILLLTAGFCVLDLITSIMAVLTHTHGNWAFFIVFACFRIVQMAALPLFLFFFEMHLNNALGWIYFACICVAGAIDCFQVLTKQLVSEHSAQVEVTPPITVIDSKLESNAAIILQDKGRPSKQLAFDPFRDVSHSQALRRKYNFMLRAAPVYSTRNAEQASMKKES